MSLFQNLFMVEEPESIGTKFQLRIFELFCVVYALIYTWEWAFYIPRLQEVVLPLGLANYMEIELFFINGISMYNAILITVFVVYPLITKQYRWFYMLAFILFHLQYAARFSQGEIPHSANLIAFSLMGLGLSGIFFKNMTKSLTFTFGFVLFFAGLGYTTAAISKLVATGPLWIEGSHLWLWIGEKSIDILSKTGEFEFSLVQEMAMNSRYFASFLLLFGLLTEISGCLIWWKQLRPYVITALIFMHIGIDLSMNIFFTAFTLQLLIMGYSWNKQFNKSAYLHKIAASYPTIKDWVLY